MTQAEDRDVPKCPCCGSIDTYRDSPGTWRFMLSFMLFPVSLLLLLGNINRYCAQCGSRFKVFFKYE
jgi:hypothetical protein